jgi:hypothetical protein
MADDPIRLSSASALSPEERTERETFEREERQRTEASHLEQDQRDLEVWRGVGEQLLSMVESDLRNERGVRSASIAELMVAVSEAIRGTSLDALRAAIRELSTAVWGPDPEPDGPMTPALAQKRRAR